jgi:hypothetical protein
VVAAGAELPGDEGSIRKVDGRFRVQSPPAAAQAAGTTLPRSEAKVMIEALPAVREAPQHARDRGHDAAA